MNYSMPGFPVFHCLQQSLLKLMSIELVMPSNHLILCCTLLFLPSIFPSIRVFSNESALCIMWPKDWSINYLLFYYCTLLILSLFCSSPHRFQYLPSPNTCMWGELGFPGLSAVKNPPVSAVDSGVSGLVPGSGRSPGVGNGNPPQYSCLENSMDRGAWWTTAHGVTKSQTQLSIHASK